jgi:hypothetical protein
MISGYIACLTKAATLLYLFTVSRKSHCTPSDYAILMNLALVYAPPHVARKGCYVFDEMTGQRKHVPGHTYYSAYGKLLEKGK